MSSLSSPPAGVCLALPSTPLHHSLTLRGQTFSLSTPATMGVLNMTPDSFYANSRVMEEKLFLQKAAKYCEEGVDFLDIGGYSSRPGAPEVAEDVEIARVAGAVALARQHFPSVFVSIDTFRASVAQAAWEAGADMVNDISGGTLDPNMFAWVAQHKVPYVLMHMKGTPLTMSGETLYENVVEEVFQYLHKKLQTLRGLGVADVVIDVGFGFAKTLEQNYVLLKNLSFFQQLEAPVLVGLSRKSMVYKALGITAEEALPGTTALHMAALCQGAKLLRVHDVKEAKQIITLYQHVC